MPELPEVETVRRGLTAIVEGTSVESVEVRRDSCVRLAPGGAAEFAARLLGPTLGPVARRGKFLWIPLSDPIAADDAPPRKALVAHLGMSGQFRSHELRPDPHPHCRARLTLSNGLVLDFLDQRTFGYLHVDHLVPTDDGAPGGVGAADGLLPASASHIARDVLDPFLDERAALVAMRRGTRAIKQVLLDQRVVSGIGNIYADEALWLARIHPDMPAGALGAAAARRLLDATRDVMEAALEQGGTSFDALYVNVNGESGYFSRSLQAYGQTGRPCARCGSLVTRFVQGGRSTHICPRCQRTPRVARRLG